MGRDVLVRVNTDNLSDDVQETVINLSTDNSLNLFTEHLLELYIKGDLILKDKDLVPKNEVKDIEHVEIIEVLKTIQDTLILNKEESNEKSEKIIEMLGKGVTVGSNVTPFDQLSKSNQREEQRVIPKVKPKVIVGGGKGPKGKMANLAKLKKLKGD